MKYQNKIYWGDKTFTGIIEEHDETIEQKIINDYKQKLVTNNTLYLEFDLEDGSILLIPGAAVNNVCMRRLKLG